MRALCIKRSVFALTCGLAFLYSSCSMAQPATAIDKNMIVVAVEATYPPFEYKDPATDKLTGFDVDLGNALAAKLNIKIEWQETNFQEMISAVATKRVDVILSGMSDLPERRDTLSFVDYIITGPQFYTKKDFVGKFPTMEALCGKNVGASRVSTFASDVEKWSADHCVKAGKPAITVIGTNTSSEARLQLRQNRIDAAVQGGETLPYQNSIEQNAYVPVGKPFLTQYAGIGVAKGNAALATALETALNQLIADGTYQKILAKWGLQEHAISKATINGQT